MLGPTWDFARRVDGLGVVDATSLDAAQWRSLKTTYRLGELLMPCCDSPAVPKSSPNDVPFFAHAGSGCTASIEGQWHLRAKQTVRDVARDLGYHAELERPGGQGNARWCSDVWIVAKDVHYAVELQHSYQHLRDYLARQKRYEDAGVRCLWLLMQDRYMTLTKAMVRRRQKEDFPGVRHWPVGECGCLREFPVGVLELNPLPVVGGPGLRAGLAEVIAAFVDGNFQWSNGQWCVTLPPLR